MGSSATPSHQTQNSSSNSISTVAPYIKPLAKDMVDDFWGWYQQNKTAPTLYPGQMFAPMSTQTQRAFDMLEQRGTGGSPVVGAGNTALMDTLSGKYLGANPYLSDALAAEFGQQNRRFTEDILPTLDAKFAGAGRTAGGAHINTSMRMASDLAQAQADATAKAVSGEYGAERGRMLQAAGMAPGIAQEDYRDIEAVMRAGQGREGYDQKAIDEGVLRHNYAQTGQADWYARMGQILQGLFPGGETTGSARSWGMAMPSTDGMPPWLGAVLGAAGTAARFLPTSDRRLKTDIREVGRLHDGQKVYRYRLRGEPHHQLGLMAQEVERREPAAVLTDPLGLKHVDYARATRSAGARRAHAGGSRRSVPAGGLM